MNRKRATKNPLYVVKDTKKGSVVEEASGLFDLIVKKFGLAPAIEILGSLFESLVKMASNYAMFVVVKDFIDQLMAKISLVMGPIMGARSESRGV